MALASPYINRYAVLNDVGQQIGGGYGGSLTGFQSIYNNALGAGESNLQGRAGGLVNMQTGQLLRQPASPAEAALAQQMLEQFASQQGQNYWNQAMGLLGGGSAGGSGAAAADPAFGRIKDLFGTKLEGFLNNPGLDEATQEAIISRGSDEINQSELQARRGLREALNYSGMSEGGNALGAQADQLSGYADMRQGLARDVRIEAAKEKQQGMLSGLGVAGNYLGRVEDQTREDRNKMMELLLNKQISTPDFSAQISQAGMMMPGTSMGAGGGSNTGGQSTYAQTNFGGSASGGNNALPGFQPVAGGGSTRVTVNNPAGQPAGAGGAGGAGGQGGGQAPAAGGNDPIPAPQGAAPQTRTPAATPQPTQQAPTPNYGLQPSRSLPPPRTDATKYSNPQAPHYMMMNPTPSYGTPASDPRQLYNPRSTGANPFTQMHTIAGATPKKTGGSSSGTSFTNFMM